MNMNEWLETIRVRLADANLGELMRSFAATVEGLTVTGPMGDLPIRLIAGALAVVALGAAVILTVGMFRPRRRAEVPALALATTVNTPLVAVPAVSNRTAQLVPAVRPARRASRPSPPSRADREARVARVGHLATLGAGPAQAARAVGLSRDALAILAPAVDWSRSKLPRPARTAAEDRTEVTLHRRLTRRVTAS